MCFHSIHATSGHPCPIAIHSVGERGTGLNTAEGLVCYSPKQKKPCLYNFLPHVETKIKTRNGHDNLMNADHGNL